MMDHVPLVQFTPNMREANDDQQQYNRPRHGSENTGTCWQECKKNPGHKRFIPFSQFSLKHLPRKARSQAQYDFIKAMANLTVRIRVNHMSQRRPVRFTDGSVPDSPGIGTGCVAAIRSQLDNSASSSPKWDIFIKTAAHVVFNTEEAVLTFVDFFYDSEDSRCSGEMKTILGSEVTKEDSVADWSILRCETDNADLVNRVLINLDKQNEEEEEGDSENTYLPPILSVRRRNTLYVFICAILKINIIFLSLTSFSLAGYILSEYYTFKIPDMFIYLSYLLLLVLGDMYTHITQRLHFRGIKTKPIYMMMCFIPLGVISRLVSKQIVYTFNEFITFYRLNVTSLDTTDLIANVIDNHIWSVILFFVFFVLVPLLHLLLNFDCLIGLEFLLPGFVIMLPPMELFNVMVLLILPGINNLLCPEILLTGKLAILPTVSLIDAVLVGPVILLIPAIPDILFKAYAKDFSVLICLILIMTSVLPVVPIYHNMLSSLTVVIISHPHGKPKHVTLGRGALQFSLNSWYVSDRLIYRADTCSGSSGACVLHCYRGNVYNSKGLVHSKWKVDKWNESSMPAPVHNVHFAGRGTNASNDRIILPRFRNLILS